VTRELAATDTGLREVEDDRVPAVGDRRVVLALPRARRIAWRVTWQALDPALAHARWLPEEDVSRTVAEAALEVSH
jgi:hypothetical protein